MLELSGIRKLKAYTQSTLLEFENCNILRQPINNLVLEHLHMESRPFASLESLQSQLRSLETSAAPQDPCELKFHVSLFIRSRPKYRPTLLCKDPKGVWRREFRISVPNLRDKKEQLDGVSHGRLFRHESFEQTPNRTFVFHKSVAQEKYWRQRTLID